MLVIKYKDLMYENLSGRDFTEASFIGVNLFEAKLDNCNFKNASFWFTEMRGTSVKGIKNYAHSRTIFHRLLMDIPYKNISQESWAAIGLMSIYKGSFVENVEDGYYPLAIFDELIKSGYEEYSDYV